MSYVYDTVKDAEERASFIARKQCTTHLIVTREQLLGLLDGKFIANAIYEDGFVIGLEDSFDENLKSKATIQGNFTQNK